MADWIRFAEHRYATDEILIIHEIYIDNFNQI